MHPGLGLQPTMPHLPYFTMQGVIGMPLMATLMDVQQMHYPMGLIDYLACGAPAAKKQKAATVPLHLEMVDDYIKMMVDQPRGSVLAPVVTTRKRKRNAKNDEAIIDLFFPPLTYPISQATHSRPTPRTHVSPISSTPRPTPDMPSIARCDPHAHNSVIRHLRASNPPIHQTTGLLDPSGCRPSRPSRCPEYGPVCTAAAAPRAFSLPGRQLRHVRPAHPASLGRLSAPLLSLTMAPLGQPAPRPLLGCHGISKSRI
jgi:hypothetical protein